MDNYPDNIRSFDHDPRSPFYDSSAEDAIAEKEEEKFNELSDLIGNKPTLKDGANDLEKHNHQRALQKYYNLMSDFYERIGELENYDEVIGYLFNHVISTKHHLKSDLEKALEEVAEHEVKQELNND